VKLIVLRGGAGPETHRIAYWKVDQTPIRKTPAVLPPANHTSAYWDDIRRNLRRHQPRHSFAATAPAASHSTNQPSRPCEACERLQGIATIEMEFPARRQGAVGDDLWRAALQFRDCSPCHGGRPVSAICAGDETSTMRSGFFASPARVHQCPQAPAGRWASSYLTLGQPSPTLSCCEARASKLVTRASQGARTNRRPCALSQNRKHTLVCARNETQTVGSCT